MNLGKLLRSLTNRSDFITNSVRIQSTCGQIKIYNSPQVLQRPNLLDYPVKFLHRGIASANNASNETNHIPSHYDRYIFPEPPRVVSDEEHDSVVAKVNECMANHGRLFAVVQISSKQFKITDHDLIRTTGYLDAEVGERIRLEKVLLVGGTDFTLVGQPIIRRSLVRIEATIVEKTPGVVKVHQKFLKAKNFEKRKFYTPLHTVLRINSIEVSPKLEENIKSESKEAG